MTDPRNNELVEFEITIGGRAAIVEEVDNLPQARRQPSGESKYAQLFTRMSMDKGGLKVRTRENGLTLTKSLSLWLKKNKKPGAASLQAQPDGSTVVFWVSKKG